MSIHRRPLARMSCGGGMEWTTDCLLKGYRGALEVRPEMPQEDRVSQPKVLEECNPGAACSVTLPLP